MDRTISIHQPDFFPWLGFFEKIARSNIFVILDDVQYLRRAYHNRDKILINGIEKWITIPTLNKGNYNILIKDVKIDNISNWKLKFLKTIYYNYKKKRNFEDFYPKIEKIINYNHKYLIDLNLSIINLILNEFKLEKTKMIFSSSMNLEEVSSNKILKIVKNLNGSSYITGMGSKAYLDQQTFKKNNIKIIWQDEILYFKSIVKKIKRKSELDLSSLHHLLCYK